MKRAFALLTSMLLVLLTGCGIKSGDEFYSLPEISSSDQSLQRCIQSLLDTGLEYSSPISGTNTSPVILVDLDNDDENEAIAFFKDSSGEGNPLKIYFFEQDEDNTYQIAGSISGEGAAINTAVTCNFTTDEDSMSELVVSWQISSGVYALSAYSFSQYDGSYVITEMMPSTSYTRYVVRDMDDDGEDELVLIILDTSDSGSSLAYYFDAVDNYLEECGTARLSSSMDSVDKLHSSTLSDGTPAIYVTGLTQSDSSSGTSTQAVTDILALRDGSFGNITLDSTEFYSVSTTRYNLAPDQDINGDGVWEIPSLEQIPAQSSSSSDTFYAVNWFQYALDGSTTLLTTTYYNSTDGWYLEIPQDWLDGLSLARNDVTEGLTNERGVFFYYEADGQEPELFLAIYKNTGNNRETRATMDSRILLLSTQDATYSAKLYDTDFDSGLDSDGLLSAFHQIVTSWSDD